MCHAKMYSLFALPVFLLVGCGGGGSSSNTIPSDDLGDVVVTDPPPPLYNDTHLTQINQPAAVTAGLSGAGVGVSVIDSGLFAEHVEFTNTTINTGYNVADDNTDTSDINFSYTGHGTHVASLIAGENVGVAPGASITPIRIVDATQITNSGFIADAITWSSANTSDKILNLSVQMSNTSYIPTALNEAAALDRLFIAAAGNDGDANPDGYVLLTQVQDEYLDSAMLNVDAIARFIYVGAVDSENNIAFYSDRAGEVANNYLVAPGNGVSSAQNTGVEDYNGVSGTSFATPQVSGAAALVWEADPSLTGADVAQILLTTATDLGDPGVDVIYGHGLLNIEAALAPVGLLGIPTGADTSSTLLGIDTSITLSSAFGDSLISAASPLSQVVGLDDFNRPYYLDLTNRVHSVQNDANIFGMVDSQRFDNQTVQADIGGVTFTSNITKEKDSAYEHRLAFSNDELAVEPILTHTFALQGMVAGASWQYAESNPAYLFGAGAMGASTQTLGTVGSVNPYLGLVGAPQTAALGTGMDNMTMKVGYLQGSQQLDTRQSLNATVLEIGKAFKKSNISLTLGSLTEENALLGAAADGALAVGDSSTTQIASVSSKVELAKGVNMTAAYNLGRTTVDSTNLSMLRNWSEIASSSYGVGISATELLGKGSRLGVQYSRPLRVDEGSVELSVPVYRDLEHNVLRDTTTASLAPSGNEQDIEVYYSAPVGKRLNVGVNYLYQMEPGHVAGASPQNSITLTGSMDF